MKAFWKLADKYQYEQASADPEAEEPRGK